MWVNYYKYEQIWQQSVYIKSCVTFSWNFTNVPFLTATYRKLRKTRTVTYNLIRLFASKVALITCFFTSTEFQVAFKTKIFTVFPTCLKLTTHLFFWSLEFLLGWCFFTTAWLVAGQITWLIGNLKARMIMLVMCILFISWPVAFLLIFLWDLIYTATFFHLVFFTTVLIFLKPFLKRLFFLLLHKSDSIFVKKAFDFTCSVSIVSNCSCCSSLFYFILIFL